MLGNLEQVSRPTESGNWLIFGAGNVSTPAVVRLHDPKNIVSCQLAMRAISHAAELSSVYEQRLSAVVPVLVAGDEPKAYRNTRRVEELAGQGDDAIYKVGLNDPSADLALAARI